MDIAILNKNSVVLTDVTQYLLQTRKHMCYVLLFSHNERKWPRCITAMCVFLQP